MCERDSTRCSENVYRFIYIFSGADENVKCDVFYNRWKNTAATDGCSMVCRFVLYSWLFFTNEDANVCIEYNDVFAISKLRE